MKKYRTRGLEVFLGGKGFRFCGERLAYYRMRKNLSQKDVAIRLGTNQQIISRHETTGVLPSSEYLIAYSYIYDVSIDTLVWGK